MKYLPYLLSLIMLSANGQDDRPGYIVTVRNDTLRGFLVDDTDDGLRDGVRFKAKPGSKVDKTYFQEDVLEFGFNSGRKFRRLRFNDTIDVLGKQLAFGKINLYTVPKPNTLLAEDIVLVNNRLNRSVYITKRPAEPANVQGGANSPVRVVTRDLRTVALLNYVFDSIMYDPMKNPQVHVPIIKTAVLAYDWNYARDFPVGDYVQVKTFGYDFVGGYGTYYGRRSLRFVFSRVKLFPEKSAHITYVSSFSFQNSFEKDPDGLKRSVLAVLPFGVTVQGAKKVKPYLRLVVGVDYTPTGGPATRLGPAFSASAGLKVKPLLLEVSVVRGGPFFSAGLTF